MGGWLIGLSECNPAQFWVELFMMWQSGGIRKHLVYGSVGAEFSNKGEGRISNIEVLERRFSLRPRRQRKLLGNYHFIDGPTTQAVDGSGLVDIC